MQLFRTNEIELENQTIYTLEFHPFNVYDYFDLLTAQEVERALAFKSIKRRHEFVATRILRHEIFGFNHIKYNEVGAPYIEEEGFISISHADGIVGIALNKFHEVSLDIETVSDQAIRLRKKFLSENESVKLNIDSPIEMTKAWSLKEVLYKLSGKKGLHFKEQLLLEKQNDENWLGRIIFEDILVEVELFTFVREKVIISYNTGRKKFIDDGLQ
jgi:4'-phosphopantetheinyl transferase